MQRARLLIATILLNAPAWALSSDYDLTYRAEFHPDEGHAVATIEVDQSGPGLTELDLNAPETSYSHFEGDGTVRREEDRVIWQVPAEGGRLRYRVEVDHKRDGAWDARLTDEWTIVRLDDLFPPARSRARVGADARTRLHLTGPEGWSFETRYGPVGPGGVPVKTTGRSLDRPVGWMAAGDLGIRRTRIAGRRIAIAGPKDENFRRMDALAFLRWTLPELVRVTPTFPDRLLIVGGAQDMWRGGLSGPGSLYVHPDRPLLSGNATSTLIHELVHVATLDPAVAGADWIVEGIAEFYATEILRRTGGISEERFQGTMKMLEDWVREENGHLRDPSTGADTARAVLLFRDLDAELQAAGSSLDAVTAKLLETPPSVDRLRELVSAELGSPSEVLQRALCD